MPIRVGVDIGGTFTDLVMIDGDGRVVVDKVPSTPPHFARGVIDGLSKLPVRIDELDFFSHGTTAATNAILEKKGARTGLITTAGFRDVLEIGAPTVAASATTGGGLRRRSSRANCAARCEDQSPLMARCWSRYRKRTFCAPSISCADTGSRRLRSACSTPLSIPSTKSRAEDRDGALAGGLRLLLGRLLPELLEFERTSTTVANAYVGPVISRYLSDLEDQMHERGFADDI